MNHNEHDEDDELWQLLGKAQPPRVSPFFSRNVLRAIREEQPEPGASWFGALRRRWRVLSYAAALLAVCAGVSIQAQRRQIAANNAANAALDEAAHEVANSPDFPVIENLDTLLASDDNDVWLDPSPR